MHTSEVNVTNTVSKQIYLVNKDNNVYLRHADYFSFFLENLC